MKPFEIALFKHFIEGKGMTTVYINSYRKRHRSVNPISIEEFLANAGVKDVCTNAFYFVINERWGYDYWMQMQKEWLEFLEANENNHSANEWWKMQGIAKILRYNWDAAKHWKQESRYTAAIRLGIKLSLLGLEDKEHTAPPTKMSEEYLREKGLADFNKVQKEKLEPECPTNESSEIDDDDDDEMDILGDFVDIDLKTKVSNRRRLKDDEISINVRKKSNRITFNKTISASIRARGGYEYASLLRNKQGDVIIKLNDESGVPVHVASITRERSNVIIQSQVFVEKVISSLDIKRDYEIIKLKEVAKTNDFVAYLLTKR